MAKKLKKVLKFEFLKFFDSTHYLRMRLSCTYRWFTIYDSWFRRICNKKSPGNLLQTIVIFNLLCFELLFQ